MTKSQTSSRILVLLLVGCAPAVLHAPPLDHDLLVREEQNISATLDDWHAAASDADEARYFAHFSEDAVFLGTDATERWTREEFQAYAHPHFERGHAWSFRSTRRDISISLENNFAWFDEDLETASLGPARGSGVLRRIGDGRWLITQYNLTITVPNERFGQVRSLLQNPDDVCLLRQLPTLSAHVHLDATPTCMIRSEPRSRTVTVQLDQMEPMSVEIPCFNGIRAPPAVTVLSIPDVAPGVHQLRISAAPDGVEQTVELSFPALQVVGSGQVLVGSVLRVRVGQEPGEAGSTIDIAPPQALALPGL